MEKDAYLVKDIICPFCRKSLIAPSGNIQLPFTYENKLGSVELDPRLRVYDIILHKENVPLDGQVQFFCDHCKKSLHIPKENKYFHFVVLLDDKSEDYAFMSSVYGDTYTIVAAKSMGEKFVRGALRLEQYRCFDENNRYQNQIEHYSRKFVFIAGYYLNLESL